MAKTGGIKNRRNNLGRCSVCDGVEGKHVPSCSSQLKTSASPETPTPRNVPSTETGITLVIKFLERLKCGLEEPDEIDEMIDVLRANNDLRYAAEEALVALSVFKITDWEKPYAEVSPTYRKQLLKAHDLLFNTLGKPGSEVHAGQAPTASAMQQENKPIGGSPQTSEVVAKKAAKRCSDEVGNDWYENEFADIIQSAIDAAAHSFSEPCDVCGGTGTPASKRPCICNGSGLMSIAVIELRKLLFDAERKLDAAARVEPTTDGSASATTPLTMELSTVVDRRRLICELIDAAKPYLVSTYGRPMDLEEAMTDQFMEYLGVITAFLVTQRDALISTQTTKPTITEGKESPPCAVKDQKG